MAVNFVSVFANANRNCYYKNGDGKLCYPVITGNNSDPSKYSPKKVVRIPPSYGSGAYYSRQAFTDDGVYQSIVTDGDLKPASSMNLTAADDADHAAIKLYMYSDGQHAECARLMKTGEFQYWYVSFVSEYKYYGYPYFVIDYYHWSVSPTDITYWDFYLNRCRAQPRLRTSAMAASGIRTDTVELQVSADDWLEPFLWHDLTGCLDPPFSRLASTAYVHLVDNLPATTVNTMTNVLDIAGGLAKVLSGKFTLSRKPSDIWLAYRYSYTTSKSDLEELIQLTKRLTTLPKLDDVTVHSLITYKGVTCRCSAIFSCDSLLPRNTSDWLETYGFKLSLLNAWDMIPYSFVVDWFLHISSFLEDMGRIGKANTLHPKEVWYSFKKKSNNVATYFRVQGDFGTALPFFGATNHQASGRTILYRIADSLSLFLG